MPLETPKEPTFGIDGGRVWTILCPCKWEAVFVLPEDCFRILVALIAHAREHHESKMPNYKMQSH